MILYATAMQDPEAYARYADPALRRVGAHGGSRILRLGSTGLPARDGNLLREAAAAVADLEALVIVHERVELRDPGTDAVVRAALADPEVALAGPLGASGVRGIAWWEGRTSAAPVTHRYHEHGGGDLPAFAWTAPDPAPRDVDVLDGALLVLSPWAVRELAFDEGLGHGFGHDVDLCLQARERGRRVVTAPIPVVRHRPLELVEEIEPWVAAHVAVGGKWSERAPHLLGGRPTTDWEARARRAEADREAARTVAYSANSMLEVRVRELEAALGAVTDTPSWRLTEPLRRLNARRRRSA